jgi:hypothetical protein
MHFFILFRHHNKKYGYAIHPSFFTCFASLRHHQVLDSLIYGYNSIGQLVFLHWPLFTYWNTVSFSSNIFTYLGVTIAGVWIGELDLLASCTHHSELQVITALSLISTLYKSLHAKSFPSLLYLQQPFSSNGFQQWRFLQLPALTSLLSGAYPATELIQPSWGPRYIAHGRTQQKTPPPAIFYCCYGHLPSNSPDIADVFTGRYQATYVPSRDHCIAMVLHATCRSM